MHPTSAFARAVLFCVFLLTGSIASAQNYRDSYTAKNALYAELGGNGDVYSLNFDRIVYQKVMFKAGFRVGLSSNLFFLPDETGVYPVIPVEALGMIGRYQKNFEFGLGYTRRFTDDPDLLQNMYFSRIGFRYQPPQGGLVVRVAFTPFLSTEINYKSPGPAIIPRFGLSVGRSF
ncbi:MAG: hypothetical protein LPK09_05640 [Hymenobacteraceae bacterium]|nr:hypothetical protein [Hymenobacteraceae bacterium]